tara:strand:+ start:658 stop:759 length:102 start_codon:yes stop_codon:yes gene_type:complete
MTASYGFGMLAVGMVAIIIAAVITYYIVKKWIK